MTRYFTSCAFAISSGSGVNNIPSKLGRPQLIINVWNFGYVAEKSNLVWPTRLVSKSDDRVIGLDEQFGIINT